jgi:predicted dehydrogenase
MAQQQLGIGIIGAGQIAQAHMKNFAAEPRCQIRGVAELNAQALTKAKDEFKIPVATDDYKRLLADPAIDAVVVCTPVNSHREIGIAALQAGKHLLCEKPLTLTMPDAYALLAEAKRHPALKVSGCSCRHARLNPKFAFIKQLIDDGKLGRVYLVHHRSLGRQGRGGIEYNPNAKWFLDRAKAGGGPLYDWGVYDLSFHLGILGEPEFVRAEAFCINGLDQVPHNAPAFTVEEHGGAFMSFAAGLKYYWERASNVHSEQPNQTSIMGTKGGIKFGYCSWDPNSVEYFDVAEDTKGKARKETLTIDMSSHQGGDMAPLGKAFVDYILGLGPVPMPIDIEVKNLAIMHAVYQAAQW